MQITGSMIQLSSTHTLTRSRQQHETLDLQLGRQRLHQETENGQLTLSRQSLAESSSGSRTGNPPEITMSATEGITNNPASTASDEVSADDALPADLKLIKRMLEFITGQVIKLATVSITDPKETTSQQTQTPSNSLNTGNNNPGFGLRYQSDTTSTENEHTRFGATGIIRTGDGKEIHFHLDLALQRSFTRNQHQQISMGTLRDPLVINLGTASATLDQQQFSFDLNSDGKVEKLHTLHAGSGFLALDRNHDGMINNGGELFGTTSGSGFNDLAGLDNDHNGWIDSHDKVFSSLRIWSPKASSQTSDTLSSLQSAGVGAIYLGKAHTPLQLQGGDGSGYGQLRSTGLYVAENGAIGTVQQLDLAV